MLFYFILFFKEDDTENSDLKNCLHNFQIYSFLDNCQTVQRNLEVGNSRNQKAQFQCCLNQ